MYLKSVRINGKGFPTLTQFPFNVPVFQQTEEIEFTSPVVFLTGQNGSGKIGLSRRDREKGGTLAMGREQDPPCTR